MNFGKKLLLITVAYFFSIVGVLANDVDNFKVIMEPSSAKAGEAIDLIIEAVDKNNVVVTDYKGMVLIFSESDPEAELPILLEENTYTFKSVDQGKIVFENAVKFFKEGKQNIHVYDFNNDAVFGIGEVDITKDSSQEKLSIEIISPENGLTVGSNKIKISGTTEKNHKIKVLVNGKDEIETISNNQGIFEVETANLIDGKNTIIAKVLNSNGEIVGESKNIEIKTEQKNLSIISAKVNPIEVFSEGEFEIEVTTTPGLREVSSIINDVITKLEEEKDGVYKAKIFSPKDEGSHKIDILLKDELGNEKKELGAANIKVNKVVLNSAEPVEEKKEEKVDLSVKGLKLIELKTKSILTWDKVELAKSYNVYKKLEDGKLELIENVVEPKFEIDITGDEVKYEYFAVKAMAETSEGEIYEGDLSEATKIQTGPELLILLIISIFVAGLYAITKQKKA